MRLFFAIEIPEDLRNKAAEMSQELQEGCHGLNIKWVPPENFHLTLLFLGEIPAEKIPDMSAAAKETARGFSSFKTELGGLGVFPNPNRPRVIWIGMSLGKENFSQLAKKLGQYLLEKGFSFDQREPSAHLTLGRLRDAGSFPPAARPGLGSLPAAQKQPPALSRLKGYLERPAPTLGWWTVNEFGLMESKLGRGSPQYFAVEKFSLGV